MIEIAAQELNKYYGSNHVLKGIAFEIYTGERVGLLGKNGSGKTTLFKVITGEEPYESGSVSKASGKKAEMLAQIPVFGENDTAEDVLRSSFAEIADIQQEMKRIEGDETPSALVLYGRLMEEYERLGGYDTEVKLDKVCNGMGKFAEIVWSMENGMITAYDCGFDEYLEMTRPVAIQKRKNARKNPSSKEKTQTNAEKSVPTEDLIIEVEAELKKVNAAIDSALQQSEFLKMNALYTEKSRLEEKIDSLYNAWGQGN